VPEQKSHLLLLLVLPSKQRCVSTGPGTDACAHGNTTARSSMLICMPELTSLNQGRHSACTSGSATIDHGECALDDELLLALLGDGWPCPPGQWESAGSISTFGSKEILMSDPPLPYLETLSSALAGMTANASAGIVSIHSRRSSSSGFAWRPDLVVTADGALAEEGDVSVALPGGERRSAQIVGRDPTTDIALLRVEGAALTPKELIAAPVARP
jgi:S1-C subfamily serine protease